jgi:hypothetical protein
MLRQRIRISCDGKDEDGDCPAVLGATTFDNASQALAHNRASGAGLTWKLDRWARRALCPACAQNIWDNGGTWS